MLQDIIYSTSILRNHTIKHNANSVLNFLGGKFKTRKGYLVEKHDRVIAIGAKGYELLELFELAFLNAC